MEPVVVKTVSYRNVSAVTVTLASALVIKEVFLQEKKMIERARIKKLIFVFIDIKNNKQIRLAGSEQWYSLIFFTTPACRSAAQAR
jgi:hypothetical protein